MNAPAEPASSPPYGDSGRSTPLLDRMRARGFRLEAGPLTVYLAEEFGFCYGVGRAVRLAYETCARYPGKRIFLTNEIIHNPRVNARLKEMGVRFLSGPYAGAGAESAEIGPQDVVIIPAFGTTVEDLKVLEATGCTLVDTTCGSVMSVWKRVREYARDGFTAVIHGKYDHEETRATCSRAGKYIVVRDKKEAGLICAYLAGIAAGPCFMEKFGRAVSRDFDPDRDLERLGFTNQTTMLSSESQEIALMLRGALEARYGAAEAAARFRSFDTICSATQDRQEAVLALARRGMDLMIVVGGFNSSNTAHLVEICRGYGPVYHVEDADGILSRTAIRHKNAAGEAVTEHGPWLPESRISIGITGGASTPDRVIEDVILRILAVAGTAV